MKTEKQRILDFLQHNMLTTLQARNELDIMHPASRVQELREAGHNIKMHWAVEDGHRIARYVLLASEVANA